MIALTFTPEESLSMIKAHAPNRWLIDLAVYNRTLLEVQKLKNCCLQTALKSYLKFSQNQATKIYVLASYQHIMDKIEEYATITSQITKYTEQLLALPNSKGSTQADKQLLTKHFQDKLTKLNARKQQLLKYPEVVNNLEVTAETVPPN